MHVSPTGHSRRFQRLTISVSDAELTLNIVRPALFDVVDGALPAASSDRVIVAIKSHQGASDMQVTTIGLDIAKSVFQVHGIDAPEKVVVRKQLRRRQVLEFFKALPPCLIGMEACATADYWARELTKLGHEVRLMPAKDVKAYVKRNKNDAADAEAICEAVRRPTMRFVQIKSTEQQGRLMLHRARDLLMRQRTQVINAVRAHLAELGIVAVQGRDGIMVQHRLSEASKRLESIPGIGVIGATAIAATVPDPKVFGSGRDFAAWIGLVPREDFEWRQTKARANLETGRSLFAAHSGGRSLRGVAICAP